MRNNAAKERRKGGERKTRECTARKTREVLRKNDYARDSDRQSQGEAESGRQGVREDKVTT